MTDPPAATDPPTTETELFCPQCGYDLRNIPSDRCPECGEAIDRKTLAVSLIPWVHRKQIGCLRAFLHTVWLATRRPDLIARESARPVSYADAQRFRWTVLFIAWLPIAITAATWWVGWVRPPEQYNGRWWYTEPLSRLMAGNYGTWTYALMTAPGSLGLNLLALLLWLIAATGVASYFSHPRALPMVRQDRAVALSYYAAAPLALLPLLELYFLLLLAFAASTGWDFATLYAFSDNFRAFWLGACAATVAVVMSWWVNTLRLLRGTTNASAGKLFVVVVTLPLLWLLLAPLIFVLLHVLVSYCLLIILYW